MDIDDDSVNVNDALGSFYDRNKILNRFGADKVKTWNRDKVILYLQNLPKTFDSQWDQNPQFTQPLLQALRDALEGPDAVVNLTELGAAAGCNRVLGNADAGRVFAAIYSNHRGLLTSNTSVKERVRKLERQRPVINDNAWEEKGMWNGFKRLCPDSDQAEWVWDLLRIASRKWMDVRFRNLRNSVRVDSNGDQRKPADIPKEPFGNLDKGNMVNTFIHGGDLRLDALMLQLGFARARYQNQMNTQYMEDLFQSLYGMSSEAGVWLCKSLVSVGPLPP